MNGNTPNSLLSQHSIQHTAPNTQGGALKHLSLALFNSRSLLGKLDALKRFALCFDFDIILVTETWLSERTPSDVISLAGYQSFRTNRFNQRGGGCMAYVKHEFTVSILSHSALDAVPDSLWLQLSLASQILYVGCIYRPPGRNYADFDRIVDAFNFLSEFPASAKIVAGDFNAPDICWSSMSGPRNLLQFLSCLRLGHWTQHVQTPTRLNNILDLVFTSGISVLSTSVLNYFPGSDHRIVSCQLQIHLHPDQHTPITPCYTSANWSLLPDLIRSSDWDSFFLTCSSQEAADLLYSQLSRILQLICCTTQSHSKKSLANKLELKYMKLKKIYHSTHDFSLLFILDRLSRQIKHDREEKLKRQEAIALRHPNKSIWLSRLYKTRLPNRKPTFDHLSIPNKPILYSPKCIADAFNSLFASALTTEPCSTFPKPCLLTTSTLSDVTFHIDEISKSLSRFKPSSYPGPDSLPPSIFIFGGPDIPVLLLKLFNISILTGVLPSQWKTSVIIPRHKKGPMHDPNNYRPINHTPIISRLMEKLVKARLVEYLLSHCLINPRQHGFLRARSCVSCQFDFLDHVTKAIDGGKAIVIIYLDMTKAFDRVPHSRLLGKIESYGITQPLLSWFSSYLSARNQVVNINGCISHPKSVTSGVIQGSVLGPVLFLMYINDIFNLVHHGTPFLFADDIKIVYEFDPQSFSVAFSDIQSDLHSLNSWCTSWLMKFSPDKSTFLTYKCQIPPGTLTLDEAPIASNPSVRDLGIHYSSSFSFSEHVIFQVAKASRSIGLIHKNFRLSQCKIEIYKSHIRPLLEFCPLIYSNMRNRDRISVENVQRKFTKQLLGVSSPLSYEQRCTFLKLDPLWLRRAKLNLCILFNLIHHGIFSLTRTEFASITSYPLRNRKCSILIPKSRRSVRSNFFLIKYASLWNKLPNHIRSSPSLANFKSQLSTFLTVESLVRILSCNLTTEKAYEVGVGL